ncbi:hypothetical protein GmHk_14G041776 [Glycine max]|nr:hypothetical protein GmHk_14G041776 [Glycine max]
MRDKNTKRTHTCVLTMSQDHVKLRYDVIGTSIIAMAIEQAYGNWKQSYEDLPKLLLAFQTSVPRTIVEKELKLTYNEHRELLPGCATYHHIFWTFKVLVDGFAYYKPIVEVDDTFHYGTYKGTLLVVVAQDETNHILPIAFALVEGKTTEA